jgi:hypothetical protein
MGRLVQHQPCRLNRVAQPFDAGYAACAQVRAVQQQGIELHAIVTRQERSPRVEVVVIFHHGSGGFHCVDRTTAARQRSSPRAQGMANTVLVGGNRVVGYRPGAAVD